MRQLVSLCFLMILSHEVGFPQEYQIKAFKSDQSPLIYGRLKDPAWNIAIPFSNFRIVEPIPGTYNIGYSGRFF